MTKQDWFMVILGLLGLAYATVLVVLILTGHL